MQIKGDRSCVGQMGFHGSFALLLSIYSNLGRAGRQWGKALLRSRSGLRRWLFGSRSGSWIFTFFGLISSSDWRRVGLEMIYKIPFSFNILLLRGNWEFYLIQQSHVPYLVYVTIIHMYISLCLFMHTQTFAWITNFVYAEVPAGLALLKLENLMAKESSGENLEVTFRRFIEYFRGLTNIPFCLIGDLTSSWKMFVKRLLNSLRVNWTDSALSKGAEKLFW